MFNSVCQIIDTFPLATIMIDRDLLIKHINSKGLEFLTVFNFKIQNQKLQDFFLR